jgi:hypothetical protein
MFIALDTKQNVTVTLLDRFVEESGHIFFPISMRGTQHHDSILY